jgi:hypothetical protein
VGAGNTLTDKCRVGSNNFGNLLYQWTNNPKVDYQSKVCSGDTTVGLSRQIDEWAKPGKADATTVSMGGSAATTASMEDHGLHPLLTAFTTDGEESFLNIGEHVEVWIYEFPSNCSLLTSSITDKDGLPTDTGHRLQENCLARY